MSEEEIEEFITELDLNSRDMCVFPNQQTSDCCDCYPCRVSYFNKVRADLREKFGEEESNE